MSVAEDIVRISVALTVFTLIALWEWVAPRRPQSHARGVRWPGNLGLALLNVVLVRLMAPVSLVGAAVAAQSNGWGLANLFALPTIPVGIVTFLLLDLVIYGQHVAFHRLAPIWRFHRVHHADLEFDVTTGLRFHPAEAAISWAVKLATVLALGVSPAVVALFEVALNATSMFNHGNVRLPVALDARLRMLLVTPDMHRVHHSRRVPELNANFGFNFPWWDRLFATYRAQPAAGHDRMELGLDQFRAASELALGRMLMQPWRAPSIPVAE